MPLPILTPEQQEKLRAAGAQPGAPAALPRTGTDTSDVWVGGLALLLIASGLALLARRRMHQI
jgi:LPXTG-motif cell wall-anchored protein